MVMKMLPEIEIVVVSLLFTAAASLTIGSADKLPYEQRRLCSIR